MIKLTKNFTRERSLFHAFLWHDYETVEYRDLIGFEFKNRLIYREGQEDKMTFWYDEAEIAPFEKAFKKKVLNTDNFVQDCFAKINQLSPKVVPILKEQKKIDSIVELKEFYSNLIPFMAYLGIMFDLPNITGLPPSDKKLALKIREDGEHYPNQTDKVFRCFFAEKFPQYSELVWVIAPDEVFGLEGGSLTSEQIKLINERKNGWAMFNGELMSPVKLRSVLESKDVTLEEIATEGVVELKGSVASKGMARGKVRLIKEAKDIDLLQDGEVLITVMTKPEYAAIMTRAAAIVTDEGGVTCHAAIVSRELKKPCVIGTKVATQVFKDGDMVEVDANHGLVRKISV